MAIKPENLSQKQLKEVLLIFLVGFLILIAFDYFGCAEIIFTGKGLRRFSYKGGEIIRSAYFLVFSATCYYNTRSSFTPKKSFLIENSVKVSLFIISFIAVVLLIMINSLSQLYH